MKAATEPRSVARDARMLVVDRNTRALRQAHVGSLADVLDARDVVVVNDAATFPASLEATTATGAHVEVRLVAPVESASPDASGRSLRWSAVLFGSGDWRTPTEHRPRPPALAPGDTLDFGALVASIASVSAISPRFVELAIDASEGRFWSALYRMGRPIQYAYMQRELAIDEVQTPFASRPWAAEMPSAGRGLDARVREALRAKGIGIATLTHAAGLSATGDDAIDAALPFPERYELPRATVAAIEATKVRGGRVVAVGTTVARALEGNFAAHGELRAGTYVTDLVLGESTAPRVVDALLTGTHEPSTSHYGLLRAFVDDALLDRVVARSDAEGFLLHEFGDAWLVIGASASTPS